jgi:hypothetical protein
MAFQAPLIRKTGLLLSFVVIFCLGGCVSYLAYEGAYEGKVIDRESGKPIEGAVVHGVWYKSYPGSGGATPPIYDSREVLTGTDGRFVIQGQGALVLSNLQLMDITVIKAGYTQINPSTWGVSGTPDIEWQGETAIIKLRSMTLETRKQRRFTMPVLDDANKMRLLTRECDKERTELGLPSEYSYNDRNEKSGASELRN